MKYTKDNLEKVLEEMNQIQYRNSIVSFGAKPY